MQSWSKQEMQAVMITNTHRKEVKERKEERECLYSSLILKMFKNPEIRGYDHLNTPNNDGSKQGMQAVMIINTQKGRKEGRERKGKEGRKRMLVLSHLAMIHVLLGGVFFAKFPK